MMVPGARRMLPVAGLATCVLVVAAAIAAAMGHVAVAAVVGIVGFAVGAAAAGADSRSPGDWTAAPRG